MLGQRHLNKEIHRKILHSMGFMARVLTENNPCPAIAHNKCLMIYLYITTNILGIQSNLVKLDTVYLENPGSGHKIQGTEFMLNYFPLIRKLAFRIRTKILGTERPFTHKIRFISPEVQTVMYMYIYM